MAESVKSVLYVDYDSIHRSLKASGSPAADRLAQRAAGWVAAIESGRLVVPKAKAPTRRRMQARRCYTDPVLLGKGRLAFVACGFEVIDAPIAAGHQRNSAGLQIVLDAMDALAEDGPYDEFVLLSADTDLAPALQRLRAQGKSTVIYAPADLGEEYRALSDGQVDESLLIGLLTDDMPGAAAEADAPPPEASRARPPVAAAGDRNEVETLARKVNTATNVPVFAPRTFADLFRFLAEEVAESGYHFHNTAENVTAKLAAAGRNVTRRQVMFVVKGLALKGHVFSTTDTAERLAEVFREQVNYLIDSAGIELGDRERELLPLWIAGRAAVERPAAPEQKPARARVESDESRAARRKQAKPAVPPREAAPAREAPPPREPVLARETPPARESAVTREVPAPREAAPPPPRAKEPPPKEPPPQEMPASRPAPAPVKSIEEIRKAAANRLSPSAKPAAAPPPRPAAPAAPKPTAPSRPAAAQPAPRPTAARPAPARPQPAPPAPPAPRQSPAPSRAAPAETDKEALESSILAAIAQAVDVLVEDSGSAPPGEETGADLATPESQPEPNPSEGGESDDIGDEIQRIIASYSRARQQGGT